MFWCSDVCGDRRRHQTLAEMCRNMGNFFAVSGRWPGKISGVDVITKRSAEHWVVLNQRTPYYHLHGDILMLWCRNHDDLKKKYVDSMAVDSWLLVSPGHQQLCHWLCIHELFTSVKNDFNYGRSHGVEKWLNRQMYCHVYKQIKGQCRSDYANFSNQLKACIYLHGWSS